MNVTLRCLNEIQRRTGATTGKELADLLGVVEMSVSRYRSKGHGMSDEVALRAAEILGIAPNVLLAALAEERAQTEEAKSQWRKIRDALSIGEEPSRLCILC